jgi:hypothetical protein
MKTFYEYVYEMDLLEAESPKKKILKKAPEEKALAKRQNQKPQQNISAPQAAIVKKVA